jgi:hypothetical protein
LKLQEKAEEASPLWAITNGNANSLKTNEFIPKSNLHSRLWNNNLSLMAMNMTFAAG